MTVKQRKSVEVIQALKAYPYFILNREMKTGTNLYKQELVQIKQNYIDYEKGVPFSIEGTSGDYIGSSDRYRKSKSLIDKQARFMFSQTPDINIQSLETSEQNKHQLEQYQKLVRKVLEKSNFSKVLLQSAKDCFIGKRVAGVVDYSERDGARIKFYNSLQFYHETEYGSDRITKFISFENVNRTKTNRDRVYIVNKYEEQENGTIIMSSTLYDGVGGIIENVVSEQVLDLEYIPVVVITNDGLLEDVLGVSDIEGLTDLESTFSKLSNSDVDSERKGMNPIRYTVDMNPLTTKSLPSGAGAYWDLQHNQNINDPKPSVGMLAPPMNHTEAVKTTLERIETQMYDELDIPNISQNGLLQGITSFKALRALYYPLETRCNEKLKTWIPALQFLTRAVIDIAKLNKQKTIELYVLEGFEDIQFEVEIVANYALVSDENEEKVSDLEEIAQNARSRKSYIKKWRGREFTTDEQVDKELMQIAIENNMFDTMSMNAQVQSELNKVETEEQLESIVETEEIETE